MFKLTKYENIYIFEVINKFLYESNVNKNYLQEKCYNTVNFHHKSNYFHFNVIKLFLQVNRVINGLKCKNDCLTIIL